jgi:protein-arginine kinase activator protein McsA
VEGHCHEAHFCQQCSEKALVSLDTVFTSEPPVSIVKEIVKEIADFVINKAPIKTKGPCPQCGHTIADIRKTQRLGCPNCHVWYHAELHASILKAHSGATQHFGKIPKWQAANKLEEKSGNLNDQLERLEFKLVQAIKKEEYEAASIIRDAIAELKKKIQGS